MGRCRSLGGCLSNVSVEFLGPTPLDRVDHQRDDERDDDQANDGEDACDRGCVGKEADEQAK